MICHGHLKACARLFLPVALCSFQFLAVQAQSELPDAPAETESHNCKQNLEIKLRTLTPLACLGSSLKLELEVTNNGEDEVRLNRAYFWNSYHFSPLILQGKDQKRKYFITHYWPVTTNEDIFYLAPGATHIETRDWPPEEVDLAGTYTLEMYIHGTKNRLQFELSDCGNLQKIEDKQ